ncbi:hypothetical protein [Devosia sp. CN2-171]|uniref:hypothetical protein n=1 Tax=Devosia sp. CN2-171 TaxID=3400909 RepID=UPI003BF804D9
MSDAPKVNLPQLGLMRRFLRANGWSSQSLRNGALELFTLPGEGATALEIVLPANSTTVDADRRLMQALRTLAGLVGREIEWVAHDVAMFDFDIVRARLPDNMVLRDSVSLNVAERFLRNARRLLGSAAAAELKRSIYVEDNQIVGAEYVNRCRFGHTFRGSFGFTIESEAGPSPAALDEEPGPVPFERRVIERIAKGLATLERAALLQSHEPLIEMAAQGFNVNMLDDFTRLLGDSSAAKITFDITLTSAWPAPHGLQLVSEVPGSVLPLVDAAVSYLKPPSFSDIETIVGKVIRLETRENPADLLHEGTREIVVEGESQMRGPTLLRVKLVPHSYLVAVDAHRSGQMIKVVGLVKRSSRGNLMASAEEFSVI